MSEIVALGTPEAVHEDGNGRHAMLVAGAQDLRYFPSLGDEIVAQRSTEVRATYNGHPPIEADYWTTRNMRNMVWGTLAHVLYGRLLADLLPQVEQGEIFATAAAAGLGPDLYTTPDFTFELNDSQAIFMRTGAAWLLGASEALFREIEQTPNHYYRGLIKTLEKVYAEAYDTSIRYTQSLPPEEADRVPILVENWKDQWRLGMLDNLFSALQVLELRSQSSRQTSMAALGCTTLANADRLGWASSVNKSAWRAITGDGRFSGVKETGPGDQPICSYVLPSLHEGPWRVRQLCSGQYPQNSPFFKERYDAQRFFGAAGVPCEGGVFDTSTALLVISTKIAEESLWQEPVRT